MRWQEIKDSAEGNNKKIGGECLIINNEIMIMLSTSILFCPFFSLSLKMSYLKNRNWIEFSRTGCYWMVAVPY